MEDPLEGRKKGILGRGKSKYKSLWREPRGQCDQSQAKKGQWLQTERPDPGAGPQHGQECGFFTLNMRGKSLKGFQEGERVLLWL